MQKAKVKGEVNVYMELLNFCGDTIDSTLVGVFRNMNWAMLFINTYKTNERQNPKDYAYTQLRVEEVS